MRITGLRFASGRVIRINGANENYVECIDKNFKAPVYIDWEHRVAILEPQRGNPLLVPLEALAAIELDEAPQFGKMETALKTRSPK
jgi:hypothetical protein